MYSETDNIFDISAPLAVFNSSLCSHTTLNPNDSNNNILYCENQNTYDDIDDFTDEDILCIYSNKKISNLTVDTRIRTKFKWKRVFIAICFLNSLIKQKSRFKIPIITITSSSTINNSIMQTEESKEEQTPVQNQVSLRGRTDTCKTPSAGESASIYFNSNPIIVNFNSIERRLARKRELNVANREGSFIIYKNLGSAASYVNTPNVKLYSIDLNTPAPTGNSNTQCTNYKDHNYYYIRKTEMRSLTLSNQSSTPLLIKNLNNKNLKMEQITEGKLVVDKKDTANYLNPEAFLMKPAYSYSSIPYIDQEELDKLFKNEYNLHVINLNQLDDENPQDPKSYKCQNCIENLFFVFKSVTSSIKLYFVPSLEKKKTS